ncbi:MAG: glycosyltransferase [Actinomycetia bacterium]|nr:glycosyltransferase [Actinomycetes bacterium]
MPAPDPSAPPLFSIVIAVRNAADTLPGALESVRAQSPVDFELIVIDGASDDRTAEIARAAGERFAPDRFTLVCEPDRGIYDAFNKGLARARGRYLAFLGADDRYQPAALAAVAAAIGRDADDEPDAVAGAYRVIDAQGHAAKKLPRPEFVARRLPRSMPTNHQALFLRTEVARRVGGFDPSYRIAGDYELFLRLLPLQLNWRFISDTLVDFQLGGTSYALRDTAREYRDAKLAVGENLIGADLIYLRNLIAGTLARLRGSRELEQ